MNILFYSPQNHRARDTESLMIAFKRQGHRVVSLNQTPGLYIHDFLKAHGIETYSFVIEASGWFRHLQHVFFLIKFCKNNKIDVVYSHLEPANFIASISQYFISARVFICRHHLDQYFLLGLDKDLSYRITYSLARHIIVFSEATKSFIIGHERISANKIIKINLGYDFSYYPIQRPDWVSEIKREVSAAIILITVGAFDELKRPEVSVEILRQLSEKGHDAKLILLGKGKLEQSIRDRIKHLNLTERVFLPGYVENVLEYISCAHFLIHPSVSESSCVVVKEAGLIRKPVIVCDGVGDFNEYIINDVNGFLIDRDKFAEQAVRVIEQTLPNDKLLYAIGNSLHDTIISLFSIETVVKEYENLNRVDQ